MNEVAAIPENTIIWHYCDLAKYVCVLSRGLFFARPSALRIADPWEGCWGREDLLKSLDATVHARPEGKAEWEKALKARREKQDDFGVSCWHENSTESAALWQLYVQAGLGIAIKSTIGRVHEAISDRMVEAWPVNYGGHQGQLGEDPHTLLLTKRPEFKHEAEVRFLVELTSDEKTVVMHLNGQVARHGRVRQIKPGNKEPLIMSLGGYSIQDTTCEIRCAPAGVHMRTDVAKLIERVVLYPNCSYSLRRAVIDITKQFGLPQTIIGEADFNLVPFDSVEFV